MVYIMKKSIAILLILALCIVPGISMASASPRIKAVDFAGGLLSGTVAGPSGRLEAVVTLFLPGNYYTKIAVPIEAGAFVMFIGTLPCECITVILRDAMTGAVFDAKMLLI